MKALRITGKLASYALVALIAYVYGETMGDSAGFKQGLAMGKLQGVDHTTTTNNVIPAGLEVVDLELQNGALVTLVVPADIPDADIRDYYTMGCQTDDHCQLLHEVDQ